jgi:hypothetical protein
MAQRVQQWRSAQGERAWLSMLVATMDNVSSPSSRAAPVDRAVLRMAEEHLASNGNHGSFGGPHSILRH